MNEVKIVECPRDAMQGITEFISTDLKIEYINSLLEVGFDTIDFGSFVSPKAIPQMRDTAEVLKGLNLEKTSSKLLAIVANKRGAEDATQFDEIHYLGFPFSISETFQLRNTNSTIEESLQRVSEIQDLSIKSKKKLLVYISMGFGNPYGDEWSVEVVEKWTKKLYELGIRDIAFADTVGVSNAENIHYLFSNIAPIFNEITFSAHLHSTPEHRIEKINAAYNAGCRKFDVAIKGFGGCPMAADDLTGNISSESLLHYLEEHSIKHTIDLNKFNQSMLLSSKIFH